MKMAAEELNDICMEMICNAGEGRSKVFEALEQINDGNYDAAWEKLTEAQELLAEAHRIQFEKLMSPQNDGTEIPFSMLLMHAMDMTMVATSEHDMLQGVVAGKMRKR